MNIKKVIFVTVLFILIFDAVILINFLDYEKYEANHIIFDSYNWKEEKEDEEPFGFNQEVIDKRQGVDLWTEHEAYLIATLLANYTSELNNMEFENLLEENTNIKRIETEVIYAWVSGLDLNGTYQQYYEIWIIGVSDEYSYNWSLLLGLGGLNFLITSLLIAKVYSNKTDKKFVSGEKSQ
ncbi:MAG: hypothetical protein NWF06_01885 [Candidatus Bathyarchaeota archaeon]|nr:hypothetical protein [Candidatus Bathyarchaeum sp.]